MQSSYSPPRGLPGCYGHPTAHKILTYYTLMHICQLDLLKTTKELYLVANALFYSFIWSTTKRIYNGQLESQCRNVTFVTCTVSQCHYFTISLCHHVIMSQCHNVPRWQSLACDIVTCCSRQVKPLESSGPGLQRRRNGGHRAAHIGDFLRAGLSNLLF